MKDKKKIIIVISSIAAVALAVGIGIWGATNGWFGGGTKSAEPSTEPSDVLASVSTETTMATEEPEATAEVATEVTEETTEPEATTEVTEATTEATQPTTSKPTEATKPSGGSSGSGNSSSTKPTEPKATEPKETQPKPTEPKATEPKETQPKPTEPKATEPKETQPKPTEPKETEPPAETIDIAALESYGRSYASSTYGYNGTTVCCPANGCGYGPAWTTKINSMDEGYAKVRESVDGQYANDIGSGTTITKEKEDGTIARMKLNVDIVATGNPNEYLIYVYYGGGNG